MCIILFYKKIVQINLNKFILNDFENSYDLKVSY